MRLYVVIQPKNVRVREVFSNIHRHTSPRAVHGEPVTEGVATVETQNKVCGSSSNSDYPQQTVEKKIWTHLPHTASSRKIIAAAARIRTMSLSAITVLRARKLGDVELPPSVCRKFRAAVRMCRCDAPPTSVKPFLSIGKTRSLHLSSSPGISTSLSREMETTKGFRLKLKPIQDRSTYAKPRS